MIATTYVDGRWWDRPERRIVPDPADSRAVVAEVSLSSAEDVDAAYAAADRSARAWARTAPVRRHDVLLAAAAVLDRDREAMARDLVREEGKIWKDASGEVARSADTLRYFATAALQPVGDVLPAPAGSLILSRRVPLGVVTSSPRSTTRCCCQPGRSDRHSRTATPWCGSAVNWCRCPRSTLPGRWPRRVCRTAC